MSQSERALCFSYAINQVANPVLPWTEENSEVQIEWKEHTWAVSVLRYGAGVIN